MKLSSKEIKFQSKNKLHSDAITSSLWAAQETIITGSLDHSIKYFDLEKLTDYRTLSCRNNAVTTLNYIKKDVIISGHEDGYIKYF